MRRLLSLLLFAWLLCCGGTAGAQNGTVHLALLPLEAHTTLRLIDEGGPFPYKRDGAVFGNYEKRLPVKPRGYYREYTVPTPGVKTRGARRIVTGGDVGSKERYYTADHYNSFKRIIE